MKIPEPLKKILRPFFPILDDKTGEESYQKTRIPIRIKLMVIISGVVLVSLVVLILVSLGIFENDMRNALTLVNSRTTELLSDKVNSEIDRYEETLDMVHSVADAAGSEQAALALKKSVFQKDSDLIAILGYTADDNPRYGFYDNASLKEINYEPYQVSNKIKNYKEYRKRAARGELIIRNVAKDFNAHLWLLVRPLRSEDDTLQAIQVALVKSGSLTRVFGGGDKKSGSGMYQSFLVSSDGQLIIHPDPEVALEARDYSDHPAVKKMYKATTRTGLIVFEEEGVNKFGAYSRLKNGNLGIVTTVKESIALEGVQIVRTRSLLVSLFIISIAILFIYYFSKTISAPVRSLVSASSEVSQGNLDVHVPPKTHDEIGELTYAFNSMIDGLREREQLKGAFGKFVNPEIAEKIMKGELALGGERRDATVFFSDIRSFTAISETLEPEEVVEFLNEYMTMMVDIIHKSKGTVDKFIGDAIMALWGVPVSHGNDAENAIRACLKMREVLIPYNEKREKLGKPVIHIGSGLNSGPVLAGQIGSEDRLEYTVIGDTVNLASRIEQLNKPFGTDILISENTYQLVKDLFTTKPMQKIKVKGKTKPQQIYAVLGDKNDPDAPKNIRELHRLTGMKPSKKGKGKNTNEEKFEIIEE